MALGAGVRVDTKLEPLVVVVVGSGETRFCALDVLEQSQLATSALGISRKTRLD